MTYIGDLKEGAMAKTMDMVGELRDLGIENLFPERL
jgi:hypothetical protein